MAQVKTVEEVTVDKVEKKVDVDVDVKKDKMEEVVKESKGQDKEKADLVGAVGGEEVFNEGQEGRGGQGKNDLELEGAVGGAVGGGDGDTGLSGVDDGVGGAGGENGEGDSGKRKPLGARNKTTRLPDIRREKGIKLVVRRLPPDFTCTEFVKAFDPLPKYNYLKVNRPDKEWGTEGRSVAWINFVSEDDGVWFMQHYNGYPLLDNRGGMFPLSVDFAPEHAVPRHVRHNKKRGSLENSEHYKLHFENKKNQKAEIEPVSVEKMLEEIESRAEKKKEPDNTPLLDFILHKKKDHSSSPEKPKSKNRDREKSDKRDKENRENRRSDDPDERGTRRERRRHRERKRDKDQKERREREKIEKDALAKGMTVTFSRTGKVTRWSANSSPLTKKELPSPSSSTTAAAGAASKLVEPSVEELEIDEENENKEITDQGLKIDNKPEQEAVGGQKEKFDMKPFPSEKLDKKTLPRDKKPFPDGKTASSGDKKGFPGDKKASTEGKKYPGEKLDKRSLKPFPSKREGMEKKPLAEEKAEKRSQPKEKAEGKPAPGDKSEKKAPRVEDRQQAERDGKSEDNHKTAPEEQEKVPKEGGVKEGGDRRRRARPDMPIYRPGSFRSGTGNNRGGGDGLKKSDRDSTAGDKGSSDN